MCKLETRNHQISPHHVVIIRLTKKVERHSVELTILDSGEKMQINVMDEKGDIIRF